MHEVKIALHPEVAVTVKVNVARSPEEADLQAQGIDVLQQMFEEDAAPIAAEELAPEAEAAAEPAEAPAEEASEATAETTSEATEEAAGEEPA
jgi:large subunit ribosomal protein L9